jgi:hypothetical protein
MNGDAHQSSISVSGDVIVIIPRHWYWYPKRLGDHRVVPSIFYGRVIAYRPYSLHLFVILQIKVPAAVCSSMIAVCSKQTNKGFKVWLRQGSKVETTKHTGVKTPFPIHWTKETRDRYQEETQCMISTDVHT